ncbi:MAG TPA: DUF2723 domain-containing protein [Gemmatimonadaceae bacterium]
MTGRRISVSPLVAGLVASALALGVYWRTAYPGITWWDSSSYSTAAATLGVLSPPGSLLLTLLGWLVTRLPVAVAPARSLNLLAGLIAASALLVVFAIALRMARRVTRDRVSSGWLVMGTVLGALTFAFSATLWEHAIKFTPYGLSALFTGFMLYTLLRWWDAAERPDAWRWIGLYGLLLGLDFSVHRTNALLVPGALAWVLVRHPATMLRWRAWLGGAAGLFTGLSVHLLIIPIARTTQSPLNMFEPTTLAAFWDYVSLAGNGGNFLVDLWPRNSPFWSTQVADLARTFRADFANGSTTWHVVGWIPALLGIAGIAALWRNDRRLGSAFTLMLLLHGAATVTYFNIPEGYFRPFDRHYLPVFLTFAVAVAVGGGAMAGRVGRVAARGRLFPVPAVAAIIVAIAPIVQLTGNWVAHDASSRHFTGDYAANALEGLPPNAVYFTVGDNDTFPVMYAQSVDGVRPDVRIVNFSLANADWYVRQLQRRYPTIPLTPDPATRVSRNAAVWRDSSVTVLIRPPDAGASPVTGLPDSVVFRPRPSFGSTVLPADEVMLDIVRMNQFRDPVTLAATVGSGVLGWLQPAARRDGAFWRIVAGQAGPDSGILRANLLDRYEYRGLAGPSPLLDAVTRQIAYGYVAALRTLLEADEAAGDPVQCRADRDSFLRRVPLDRLSVPAGERREIELRCGS